MNTNFFNCLLNDLIYLSYYYHHYHLKSVFSHLGLGWQVITAQAPHQSILCHMLLHSQQVHILHTITPLFPRPSCQQSPPNSHLPHHTQHTLSAFFTCPNHLSCFCFNLTERFSNPHISATSLLDHPSYHLTARPPILPPHCLTTHLTTSLLPCISASCDHICIEHPTVCLSIPMFLLWYRSWQLSDQISIFLTKCWNNQKLCLDKFWGK